jgi:hypothetical protein
METPQEKAKELIANYQKIVGDKSLACKCAYLCTEEIIMARYQRGVEETYWYDVQACITEIENDIC